MWFNNVFFNLNFLSDLQVYVEFDDQEWEKREWVKVYEDFQLFLLEHQLVWAKRIEGAGAGGAAGGHLQGTKAKQIQWPALVSPLVRSRCFHNERERVRETGQSLTSSLRRLWSEGVDMHCLLRVGCTSSNLLHFNFSEASRVAQAAFSFFFYCFDCFDERRLRSRRQPCALD